ncbi:hypothetical protein JOB18_000624 [Solea senegalensis]|uniref:Uncharacterized protein n=1 Tax=Solea senegalensis TaxID=28829 RepID=A0AAV6QFL6_SOLSE|nr:hypothetical protein JOB18_000624 [Solea senegalensis]
MRGQAATGVSSVLEILDEKLSFLGRPETSHPALVVSTSSHSRLNRPWYYKTQLCYYGIYIRQNRDCAYDDILYISAMKPCSYLRFYSYVCHSPQLEHYTSKLVMDSFTGII